MNIRKIMTRILTITFGVMGLVFAAGGVIFIAFKDTPGNDDFLAGGIVFFAVAFCFITATVVISIINLRAARRRERLMSQGQRYDAEIVRVYENLYYRTGFRHPLVVECGYTDRNGKNYLVKSKNIWPDSLAWFQKQEDIKATVYVNPDNPRDYYVDVTFGEPQVNANKHYDYDFR